MKTMKNMIILVFLLIPAVLSAQVLTEDRSTPGLRFTGIEVTSVFKVTLTQGEEHSLLIEAPEEHIPYIETIVSGGVLSIDYTGNERNVRGLTVHLQAPHINYIHAGGASAVSGLNTIEAQSLKLVVSGASNMTLDVETEKLATTLSGVTRVDLSGIATHHELAASGVSQVRAYDLGTDITSVKSSGTATVRITVLDQISAEASGTSTIMVRGNPEVTAYSKSTAATIRGIERAAATVSAPKATVKEISDTLVIRMGNREVTVVDGRRVQTRIISRATWSDTWTGLFLGINGYMTPDNSLDLLPADQFMDLEYNNSISVNLNIWQQNLSLTSGPKSALGMYTGLGFSWNNYRFKNNIRLVHEDSQLGYFTDTDYEFKKNKLTVSHLNIPLMIEFQSNQRIPRSQFHMSAGVNLGIRLRSHTKQVYSSGGSTVRDKDFQDFHLAPFRYEAIARIGWGRINLYASYALNEMFRDERGPELHPFSLGIRVLNF